MTWSQTINIQEGYLNSVKEEHERRIIEARVLSVMISNLFAKDSERKTHEQIYPISIDSIGKKKQKQNALSIESFFKLLSTAYENSKN